MLPPLAFHPVLKERAWGSARFCAFGKPLSSGARIGESWEIADLPDSIPGGQSIVAGGRFDGMTLRELISAQRDGVLGVTTPGPDGAFPLLVKYLDAAENLSVQVHPSAAYARAHPDARVKTEAWVVVEAEPGARLYRGFRPSVGRGRFAWRGSCSRPSSIASSDCTSSAPCSGSTTPCRRMCRRSSD
jgi:mannose-6-phosphate isomerase